jgi:hypothetical protein
MIGEVERSRTETVLKSLDIRQALCGQGFKSIKLNFVDFAAIMNMDADAKIDLINHLASRMIPE